MSRTSIHLFLSVAFAGFALFIIAYIGYKTSTDSYLSKTVSSMRSEILVAVVACFFGAVLKHKVKECNVILGCLFVSFVTGSMVGSVDETVVLHPLVYSLAMFYFMSVVMSFLTLKSALMDSEDLSQSKS